MNASIDIARILVASRGAPVPQTYRETLLRLSAFPGYGEKDCEALAAFSRLRNLLAHEYLDIRYPLIEDFATTALPIFRRLVETTKKMLADMAGETARASQRASRAL